MTVFLNDAVNARKVQYSAFTGTAIKLPSNLCSVVALATVATNLSIRFQNLAGTVLLDVPVFVNDDRLLHYTDIAATALAKRSLALAVKPVVPVQAATATATTGGTLAVATYYYKVSAIMPTGETVASGEQSQATTGTTSTVTVSWTAVPGATGYRIYRGTAAAGENLYYAVTNPLNGAQIVSFVDTGAANSVAGTPLANVGITAVGAYVEVLNNTILSNEADIDVYVFVKDNTGAAVNCTLVMEH